MGPFHSKTGQRLWRSGTREGLQPHLVQLHPGPCAIPMLKPPTPPTFVTRGNDRSTLKLGHSRTVTIWDGRAHSSPLAVRTGRSASENLDVFTKASGLFGLTVSSLRRVPTRGPVDAPSDPFFSVYATGIASNHDLQPPLSRTSNGRPASYGDMDKHLALRAACQGRRCPLTRGSPLCTLEWDPK